MKKFVALILAALMTSSLGTVALASTSKDPDVFIPSDGYYYMDDGNGKITLAAIPDPQNTDTYMAAPKIDQGLIIEPGATIYIPLAGTDANTKAQVDKMNAYTDWTIGTISGNPTIKFVKLYDNFDSDTGKATGTGVYTYCVVLKMPANTATGSYDINGTVKVARTTSKAKELPSGRYAVLNIAVEYRTGPQQSGSYYVDNAYPVILFDKADEDADINWGENGELATYEVNVKGQGKLNLEMSTKPNSTMNSEYDANIYYYNFTSTPMFNRSGILRIPAEPDTYFYEIVNNAPREVPGAKYNESYSAWELTTRKLTSYAISETKLKGTTGSSSSSEVSSSSQSSSTVVSSSSTGGYNPVLPGGKPNPDTGR